MSETSTPRHPVWNVAAYAAGIALGAVLLLGIARWIGAPPRGPRQELPHAVVLLEFPTPLGPESRAVVSEVDRALRQLEVSLQSPLDVPLLVPGPAPGDLPRVVRWEDLDAATWEAARPYLEVGGWWSPRFVDRSARQVVFRLAPARGAFASGVSAGLADLAAQVGDRATVWVYSRALGLEPPGARARINLHAGVQTAHVVATPRGDASLRDPATLRSFALRRRAYLDEQAPFDRTLRGLVTPASFPHYAAAVRHHDPDLDPEAVLDWGDLLEFGEVHAIPQLVDPQGRRAVVEVATESEGPRNLDVGGEVRAALAPVEGARLRFER